MTSSQPTTPDDDRQLILASGRGDRAALAVLYDRHAASAYRLASAICRDVDAAERAVEQTFVAIARGRVGQGPHGHAAAWLMSLLHRHALAEARQSVVPLGPLAALPDGQGEIVVLACVCGLSHAQIAEQLDVPPCAVKRLMRTAAHSLGHSGVERSGRAAFEHEQLDLQVGSDAVV